MHISLWKHRDTIINTWLLKKTPTSFFWFWWPQFRLGNITVHLRTTSNISVNSYDQLSYLQQQSISSNRRHLSIMDTYSLHLLLLLSFFDSLYRGHPFCWLQKEFINILWKVFCHFLSYETSSYWRGWVSETMKSSNPL